MIISVKNVRVQNNKFIDNIYLIYHTLFNRKIFTDSGYESNGFKIWRYNDEYFILNKSTGVIVTWHKMLGWYLASNTVLKDIDWTSFCKQLKDDLESNNIEIIQACDLSMGNENDLL